MLDEAKAMIKVSKHDHIVNIQGILILKFHAPFTYAKSRKLEIYIAFSTFVGLTMKDNSVYLLLEYCTNGPIDQYLRKHERQFRNKFMSQSYDDVVTWGIQVCDAMGFLAKNNIIHVHICKFLFSSSVALFLVILKKFRGLYQISFLKYVVKRWWVS